MRNRTRLKEKARLGMPSCRFDVAHLPRSTSSPFCQRFSPPLPPPPLPPSPPFQLETKQNKGPEAAQCVALIEAHKVCLRAEGFQIE